MATLNFKFLANDKGLQDGIKRSKKQLSGLERTTKSVASGMKRALGGVGLAIGISAITSALASAGRAAAADAKSQRLLALQMKTTTHATAKQVAGTEKYIGALSNQVGIVDDELRPAFAKLLRGTGKVAKAQKLLMIALDGAAASGKPLATISDALTKANNGNYTSLYRLAPQLKKTKGGIDEYAKSVKGAARTAADPYSKLTVILDNLNEQVGTALLPMFEALANFFVDNGPIISKFIKDLFEPKTKLGSSFAKFGKILGELFVQIDELFKNFDPDKKSGVVGFFTILNALLETTVDLIDKIVGGIKFIAGNTEDLGPVASKNIDMIANYGTVGLASIPGAVVPKNTSYNINVNKATINAAELVKEIQRYERVTGKKYVSK